MRRTAFAAALLLLVVGYIELRVPVSVGAQGENVAFNTVRTAVPIAPRYLGTGTPEIWTYLRGDGIWAGVSPPTQVSSRGSAFSITSTSYVDTGISITLAVPAATSDVLLNARVFQDNNCEGRIARGSTSLQVAKWCPACGGNITSQALEYTFVDHDPGIGSHAYSFQIRNHIPLSGPCELNGIEGLSVMIGQVLR